MYDFSQLPDVAWVTILSYLSLNDRAMVACTCHTLNDIFSHPSLWHTIKICLLGSIGDARSQILIPEKYLKMITRFGAYFQNLTLAVNGRVDKLAKDVQEVIEELSERCRLKSLTLQVGVVGTKQQLYHVTPRTVNLDVVAALVGKAFRLKSFTLSSWPSSKQFRTVNILDTLINNEKLDLEKLSIYWPDVNNSTWAPLNPVLPKSLEILNMISHFVNIQYLSLYFSVLDSHIMKELAYSWHAPLRRLRLLVTYTRLQDQGGLPLISSSDWKKLCEHSPDLEVEFTIITRIPSIDLAAVLNPEIPVTILKFMRYSRCTSLDLESITDKYAVTLCKFIDYADGCDMDGALINLVTKSPNLKYLLYHGDLSHNTALELAKCHGQKWDFFDLKRSSIITAPKSGQNFDDLVVGQNDNGECFMVRNVIELAHTEEDREIVLTELIDKISECVCWKWKPV